MKKLFLSLVLFAGIHKNIQCSDALQKANAVGHSAIAAGYFVNAVQEACSPHGDTVNVIGTVAMGSLHAGIAVTSLRLSQEQISARTGLAYPAGSLVLFAASLAGYGMIHNRNSLRLEHVQARASSDQSAHAAGLVQAPTENATT